MEQTDLLAELSKAWQSVPYLSLALIVSAWTTADARKETRRSRKTGRPGR